MLKAEVRYPYHQGTNEAILLRTPADLLEYWSLTDSNIRKLVHQVFQSDIKPSGWDHIAPKNAAGIAFNLAWHKCRMNDKSQNFWIEMDNILAGMKMNMIDAISKGMSLVVNSKGGYFCTEDENEVVKTWPYDGSVKSTYTINKGTKIINLENDPALEANAIAYMETLDDKYSFITELRDFGDDELQLVFSEFLAAGGETVYVYTTGMDVSQMYQYSDLALSVGICDFVFEFNAGMNDDIQEFINYLSSKKDVHVNVL